MQRVETDDYFYQVVRYIERNPLRANLVNDLDEWRWSSFWRYRHGTVSQKQLLSRWPLDRPRKWKCHVERPQTESEESAPQRSIARGSPRAQEAWARRITAKLNPHVAEKWAVGRASKPASKPVPFGLKRTQKSDLQFHHWCNQETGETLGSGRQ